MTPIPVFYTPRMVVPSVTASPSARKPAAVVASWEKQFPIQIIEPKPATAEQLSLAHYPEYVSAILEGRANNGFGDRSLLVAKSLPYTSGSMLSAARHALSTGKAAAAPCSGFHHAEFRKAKGFCTFNGLMVTALVLKEEGLVKKVGIVDLDMHYGDGTDNIILVRDAAKWVRHFTAGRTFLDQSQAKAFFRILPLRLAEMDDCDVVLFQAGADAHIDDPYIGFLNTEELRQRDALVFDTFSKLHVPVAWNLAGGYQVKPDGSIPVVLEIHDNTMRECVRVYST